MIPLENTQDNIVMLLVAAGVGLLGGIGAALLEFRKRDRASCRFSWCVLLSSALLGAIAAVAILYFFPPSQETVSTSAGQAPEVVSEYDLTRLVALALIVGSAGPAFLATLQTRTLALANAEQAATATEATAKQAISNVADQAATLAKASVSAVAPQIRQTLEEVAEEALSSRQLTEVVNQIAEQAQTEIAGSLEPHVRSAQRNVAAAAEGESVPPPSAQE